MDDAIPLPQPDSEYFAHLAQGRFMLQRSRSSGRFVFPPRVAEPGTGMRDLEWVAASGRGRLHAITFVSGRTPESGYNVALVDLEEGPRILSTIPGGQAADLVPGRAVVAHIEQHREAARLVFSPAAAGGGA